MTETARNKRLDELFADEPHLSPTMKARRLHEKLDAAQANKTDRVPVAPLPDAAQPKTQAMSLQRAAEILRASADWKTARRFWKTELGRRGRGQLRR